jgi:hypothetical protein
VTSNNGLHNWVSGAQTAGFQSSPKAAETGRGFLADKDTSFLVFKSGHGKSLNAEVGRAKVAKLRQTRRERAERPLPTPFTPSEKKNR